MCFIGDMSYPQPYACLWAKEVQEAKLHRPDWRDQPLIRWAANRQMCESFVQHNTTLYKGVMMISENRFGAVETFKTDHAVGSIRLSGQVPSCSAGTSCGSFSTSSYTMGASTLRCYSFEAELKHRCVTMCRETWVLTPLVRRCHVSHQSEGRTWSHRGCEV